MALNEESRLISMRILQNFVRETKGKWNDNQWGNLIQRVRKAGFDKVDEKRVKSLVDDNRERWLSGDNSVGGPPPGQKPSPAAIKEEPKAAPAPKEEPKAPPAVKKEEPKPVPASKEEPKKAEPVGEKKEEEEKRMPEPPKAVPPKPAAVPPKVEPPKAVGPQKADVSKADFVLSSKDSEISSSQAQEMHQRRLALLKRSQDLTKELSDTEIEIRRLENLQTALQKKLDELEGTRDPLEEERKKLQSEVDEVTKEIARLQQNVDSLAGQRSTLEEGVGRRKKERSEHVAAIAHLKSEKEGLIS